MGGSEEGRAWLDQLPASIAELAERWQLHLEAPFEAEASCSWVAPGTSAMHGRSVLKIGFPHMEAEHELDGLLCWGGTATVEVYAHDRARNAMLLEPCEPGRTLRHLPESVQDLVIAELLRELWRCEPPPDVFRDLAQMTEAWAAESEAAIDNSPDPVLSRQGIALFRELPDAAERRVLLATDLHAGNVLPARRRRWLVIDPKPFVGDPAYDATQHLLNCLERLRRNPIATIERFADRLEVDRDRVRLWTFARLAAEAARSSEAQSIARLLGV